MGKTLSPRCSRWDKPPPGRCLQRNYGVGPDFATDLANFGEPLRIHAYGVFTTALLLGPAQPQVRMVELHAHVPRLGQLRLHFLLQVALGSF